MVLRIKIKSEIFTGLPLFLLKVPCFARGGCGGHVVHGATGMLLVGVSSQGCLAGGVCGPSVPMTWDHNLNSWLFWVF